jgi:hypothetical protein
VLEENDLAFVVDKLMIIASAGMLLELFFFSEPLLQPLHSLVLTSFSSISLTFLT